MIEIIDSKILGRDSQYPGLFEVVFKLNKTPDNDWVNLFNNPTEHPINLQKPEVVGDKIHWLAAEKNITRDRHWIYDWVDDANKRYSPIAQQRIAQEMAEKQKSQEEKDKITELENILKSGRKGLLIKKSGISVMGLCSQKLDGCTAKNISDAIIAVFSEEKGQIDVCVNCLNKQITAGIWREE